MRNRHIAGLLVVLSCLGWATSGLAAEDAPRWTTSLRGGYWYPEVDDWQSHYGSDGVWAFGVEGGYKLSRRLEIGLSLDFVDKSGTGQTLSGRVTAEEVTYRELPMNLSLLYRVVFFEDQLLVPYVGGGFSYAYYRQDFGEKKIDGDRFGYHFRAGLQILLDALEPRGARNMRESWGIDNTYLTLETLYTSLDDFGGEEIDLGGTTLVGGLMFEY